MESYHSKVRSLGQATRKSDGWSLMRQQNWVVSSQKSYIFCPKHSAINFCQLWSGLSFILAASHSWNYQPLKLDLSAWMLENVIAGQKFNETSCVGIINHICYISPNFTNNKFKIGKYFTFFKFVYLTRTRELEASTDVLQSSLITLQVELTRMFLFSLWNEFISSQQHLSLIFIFSSWLDKRNVRTAWLVQ